MRASGGLRPSCRRPSGVTYSIVRQRPAQPLQVQLHFLSYRYIREQFMLCRQTRCEKSQIYSQYVNAGSGACGNAVRK